MCALRCRSISLRYDDSPIGRGVVTECKMNTDGRWTKKGQSHQLLSLEKGEEEEKRAMCHHGECVTNYNSCWLAVCILCYAKTG